MVKNVTSKEGTLLNITFQVQDVRTWLKINIGHCDLHSLNRVTQLNLFDTFCKVAGA